MKKLTLAVATVLSFTFPTEVAMPFVDNTIKKQSFIEIYPYQKLIEKYSKKHNINPKLIVALIHQESKFKHTVTSKKGAIGLLQLMPKTANWLKVDPYDLEQNIDGGIGYLAKQLKKYKNIKLALAAYNAGPGNVDKYNKTIPPFIQTQVYVKNICEMYQRCEHFSSSTISG